MSSIRLDEMTPFGRVAVKLDHEFAELARVGAQIESVDLQTDGGLDEGIKILNRVAKYGESIAVTMQEFAQALQEARDKAEAAAKLAADRAQIIKQRRERQDQIQDKLTRLKEEIQTAGESLAGSHKPATGELSDEDRRLIAAELAKIQEPMTRFVEAAQAIKAEAAGANFRRLERQADSIIDSLQASLRKIAQAIASK